MLFPFIEEVSHSALLLYPKGKELRPFSAIRLAHVSAHSSAHCYQWQLSALSPVITGVSVVSGASVISGASVTSNPSDGLTVSSTTASVGSTDGGVVVEGLGPVQEERSSTLSARAHGFAKFNFKNYAEDSRPFRTGRNGAFVFFIEQVVFLRQKLSTHKSAWKDIIWRTAL